MVMMRDVGDDGDGDADQAGVYAASQASGSTCIKGFPFDRVFGLSFPLRRTGGCFFLAHLPLFWVCAARSLVEAAVSGRGRPRRMGHWDGAGV